MHFPEPAQAVVTPQTSKLAGASRRYQKRIRDLERFYLDHTAFESIAASRGDDIAYEVYDCQTGTGVMLMETPAKAAALAAEARAGGAAR
jgi:oxalate decarboxylase/phosphoglucose isomerase-like protein (cupin superfamily)